METRLARGHITDLIVSEAATEGATRPVNAMAELLSTRGIEVR